MADGDRSYNLHGYALRVSALVCLACADYSLYPPAYWRLDGVDYGPWKSAVWAFAAFLAWCGSRYCSNRTAGRSSTKLDRVLYACSWIGLAITILWIVAGLLLLPSTLKDWE